ncbi:hypothetical protein NW756_007944 [Fusarium oxysporum]|nr:hypothetical protein NW756_007944 [Fusarium oxysporum]
MTPGWKQLSQHEWYYDAPECGTVESQSYGQTPKPGKEFSNDGERNCRSKSTTDTAKDTQTQDKMPVLSTFREQEEHENCQSSGYGAYDHGAEAVYDRPSLYSQE